MTPEKAKTRCEWAMGNALEAQYHDTEWGVPSHNDRHLFEMLVLEGAQAGLSWDTILKKRENYRRAFAGFDPARVALFDAARRRRLLQDPGIVRNRAKVASAVENARIVLELQREQGSLDRFVWSFVGGRPILRRPRTLADIPATTDESDALSAALRARGLRFVGSTICYAFMQACGLVNDHVRDCFLAP